MGLLVLPASDYFVGLLIFPKVKPSSNKDEISPLALEGISTIIACHNEVDHIELKVRAIQNQFKDAGVETYEIIVVSDGSDDGSNKVLERLATENSIVYSLVTVRQGKPNALNVGVEIAQYPLLLFSDVRQTFEKNSIKYLLSNLSDPEVGAVTAQLELEGKASQSRTFMNRLKQLESLKGSTTGMCGALYIIRHSLVLKPFPQDIILDDLLVALNVMKNDKRVVLEPRAIVRDVNWNLFYSGRRQGRITAGLVQILRHHQGMLFSIGLKQLIFLYGQKYLKYVAPVLFVAASVSALFTTSEIRFWHFSITGFLFLLLAIARPMFVGETLRLVLSYMGQLLKLDKYRKIKWER